MKKLFAGFGVFLLVSTVIALGLALYGARQELGQTKNQLAITKTRLNDADTQLNDIAFGVYPERTFASVRADAYHGLVSSGFTDRSLDRRHIMLLRVFDASAVRKADPLFEKAQNDDIIVYYENEMLEEKQGAVALVRPREKKVLSKGQLSYGTIEAMRANNSSQLSF